MFYITIAVPVSAIINDTETSIAREIPIHITAHYFYTAGPRIASIQQYIMCAPKYRAHVLGESTPECHD